MSAELMQAVGALKISATAKLIGTAMLTTDLRKAADLALLVGLPKSTVYRAQGEFVSAGGDEILTRLSSPTILTRTTSEILTCITDEKQTEKTVSVVSPVRNSEPVDSCAGATKELPSEVVNLDNNNSPHTPLIEKPKRKRADGPSEMDVFDAFKAYNETALRCGLAQAVSLSPSRKSKIKARLREYGADGWSRALANIEKSSFLTGGKNDFRADLDFLVNPAKFPKVHDGGYGNGRHAAIAPVRAAVVHKTLLEIEAENEAIARRMAS